jgi:hypothetical protein
MEEVQAIKKFAGFLLTGRDDFPGSHRFEALSRTRGKVSFSPDSNINARHRHIIIFNLQLLDPTRIP